MFVTGGPPSPLASISWSLRIPDVSMYLVSLIDPLHIGPLMFQPPGRQPIAASIVIIIIQCLNDNIYGQRAKKKVTLIIHTFETVLVIITIVSYIC